MGGRARGDAQIAGPLERIARQRSLGEIETEKKRLYGQTNSTQHQKPEMQAYTPWTALTLEKRELLSTCAGRQVACPVQSRP